MNLPNEFEDWDFAVPAEQISVTDGGKQYRSQRDAD
jgi:hypothetical protein